MLTLEANKLRLDSRTWPIRNPLTQLIQLDNEYWALRHGRAFSNDRQVLCSAEDAAPDLSAVGREQLTSKTMPVLERLAAGSKMVIAYSPLSRARESAECVAVAVDGSRDVELLPLPALSERRWGRLEGKADRLWNDLCDLDQRNPIENHFGAESMSGFVSRIGAGILELEDKFRSATVILVTHADCLQVLEHLFARNKFIRHYSLGVEMFGYAEVRPLQLAWRQF